MFPTRKIKRPVWLFYIRMNSYKKILTIALPAMGENFLQMLMGMVDSYLVAHLGLIAISGVSVEVYQALLVLVALSMTGASVMPVVGISAVTSLIL